MPRTPGPLLVFGPRSTDYDFGPFHPLTPRRFGPGIDLLRAVGAEPGLAPEPAGDAELLAVHDRRYLETVRRLSADPDGAPAAGIGPGDDPAFAGMHEAAAAVAGGSLAAMDAVLRGDAEHAFHPGGGLHHAMPGRASGFCIYNDPALAIERARRDGLRVLYVDLDTHHGDGVQAIFADDPGVLTFSIHESGRFLFPGTGFADELGEGAAAGTVVNVPLEPLTGEAAWLGAVRALVPALAAAFAPDVVVSQHGADAHALDPLAHLRVTTTAMGEAARIVDRVAHRFAAGRWLATGGGGYDAYRVVPRTWSLVWLAGAHRDPPAAIPAAWRERWATEAARHGQAPLPERFDDPPNAGLSLQRGPAAAEEESSRRAAEVRAVVVPALLAEAAERGWWDPLAAGASEDAASPDSAGRAAAGRAGDVPGVAGRAAEIVILDRAGLERLRLAPRVVPPADAGAGLALLRRAARDGALIVGAVAGDEIVGAAIASGAGPGAERRLLALGVAPAYRRRGLGAGLLAALVEAQPGPLAATVTVAERDPFEPLPAGERRTIATRLLERAGFRVRPADGAVGRIDRGSITARRPGG